MARRDDGTADVHPNDDVLIAHHDGVLFSADRPGVDAHLKECPRCRARLVALTEDITPTQPEPARRTASGAHPHPPRTSRTLSLPRALTALVLLGIVATAGVLTWRTFTRPADDGSTDSGLVDTTPRSTITLPSDTEVPTPTESPAPEPAADAATSTPPATEPAAAEPAEAATAAPTTPIAPTTPAEPALVIASPNRNFRWRVVGLTVERTNNGGDEWRAQSVTLTRPIAAGTAPSAAVCWLVGRAGAVFVAVGATWKDVSFPENVDLVKVAATDSMTATITTADGRQFTTTDQGFSWIQVLP